MTDWSNGFGYPWHTNEAGFLRTTGNVDTRHGGIAMMFTDYTESDTDQQAKRNFLAVRGGDELLVNGTFETAGAGGADVFGTWAETAGDGAIAATSVAGEFHGGAVAAKLTAGATANTKLAQTVTVVASTKHNIVIWNRGDGTYAGRYLVYDVSNAANIIAATSTAITGTTFSATAASFTTPVGCTSIRIDLMCPSTSTGISYFDDISLISEGDIKDWIYAGTANGVRRWTDTLAAWEDASPVASNAANQVWGNGKYVFAILDGNQIFYGADAPSTIWTGTGHDTGTDYKWVVHHDGYVYAGRDTVGGLHCNEVYYDSSITMSDLHGTPETDPTVIYVGIDGWPTLGAFSFQGDIYVPRGDGMYRINKERDGATKVLDFSDQASSSNFSSWALFNGMLFFPIRDCVYRWNGISLMPVTPPRLTDTFPYTTYGSFDNFTVVGPYLFMTASYADDDGDYSIDLICFDGADWHKMCNLVAEVTSTTADVFAMGYDARKNRLWISLYDNTDYHTVYIPFRGKSEFPYADFPTTGTHSLITSRIDAGFRKIKKSTPSIFIEASNCTASRYLKVYYDADGSGTWTAWGGVDGTTNVIQSNGITELKNPLGPEPSTLEYNFVQIRIDFVTTQTAQTPILEGMYLKVLLRPDVAYGYSFIILAGSNTESGLAQDVRRPSEIMHELRDARDSKSPIRFVDLHGDEHTVYVSSINELAVEEKGEAMGPVETESRVVLTIVEVG